ncbi:MAG: hypothetical protein MOGMAGMI_02184 [Candidatus Omnitrophica bacterium]|nr:hypothetical protein [Candidatus Omnitrophota bacterium]
MDGVIISLHLLAAVLVGLSLFPALALFYGVWKGLAAQAVWIRLLALSFSLGIGYFLFGTTLVVLCGLTRAVFGWRIRPGLHPMYSPEAAEWAAYNSLVLVANAAFLDVLRVSFYQTWFYRLMGAKVGSGVRINTGGLADLELLEIGDNALIGGGTALICHGFERGFVRLAPTRIGANVSIGLNTVIMPDCQIGDGAVVTPCSYLPKGTRIPPKALWGGSPARDLRTEKRAADPPEND